jgi:hypothetical protein
MAGVKALRKIQLGSETTAGTDVAATVIWRGLGTMSDDREVTFVDEDVGILSGTDRTYIPKLEASISLEETPATWEQLPNLLDLCVESETGTQDGAGSDYIYVHNFPTTATRTIKTATVEAGDNQQAEEMHYAFGRSLTLSGAGGAAVMVSADLVAQMDVNPTTTYTALTLADVDEILFGNTSFYIDGTGTYPATTQVSNVVHEFSLNINDTGFKPKYVDAGSLKFPTHFQDMPDVTLDITFLHGADVVTEKANWRNETARAIQLSISGPAVTTAGTTYSNKTLIVDLVGKWESFEPIGDIDGNDVIQGTFRGRYNSTAAAMGRITVVNEDSNVWS